MNRSALYWRAASFAVAAGFVGIWQLIANLRLVSPVFLPGPDRAWAALVHGFASGDLWDKVLGTLGHMAGGWFVASIVHPCLARSERGSSSWPPGRGYDHEGWWISPEDHNPEGVRIRVGATHRKLSTYLNALIAARLEAELFVEPPAPAPTYLLWRCRRR